MRNLYDHYAQDYIEPTGNYALFPGLEEEIRRFHLRADTTRPLLDLGCGVGRDTEYLTTCDSVVIAADLSIGMLQVTRKRCGSATAGLVQLSMTDLPFAENSFGGVWACASILHIPTIWFSQVLTEILRVLSPGGTVAISMKAGSGEGWRAGTSLAAPRWFTLVNPAIFSRLLRSAGFVNIESTPSGRGSWFVVEADKP
jgi:SAM-dependent methyltransferase